MIFQRQRNPLETEILQQSAAMFRFVRSKQFLDVRKVMPSLPVRYLATKGHSSSYAFWKKVTKSNSK